MQTSVDEHGASPGRSVADVDFGQGVLMMSVDSTKGDVLVADSDVVGAFLLSKATVVGMVGLDGDTH